VIAVLALIVLIALIPACNGDNSQTGTSDVGNPICGEDIDRSGTPYIQNSDFKQGLTGWQKFDNSQSGVNRVEPDTDDNCGEVVSFIREGSNGATGLFGLQQQMTIEKAAVRSLKLQMIVRIDNQQLTSDGLLGGETPIFVNFDYETAAGEVKTWTHGFMVNGSKVNYPDRDQTITPSYWYQYEVDDVFAKMPDAARITAVSIGGSGQDFHSSMALFSLMGK